MSSNTPSPHKKPLPFGKYLLLDRINIGGMAEVWRGKTFGTGGFERIVAIKRILPNVAEDEEFISMFIDEAKITVQLTHAHIAQIYELGHIQNSYFISMEYIPGKDVRAIFDRCRKKGEPAPVPLTCYVVSKMCEGLDYAHRKKDGLGREMNIVHRDVSPQNILISYEGEVKVIDFGIAKAVGKASKTQAGILKGKFGYMSPEQVRGIPVDRRSDVFAVGVCLYEMLTGERLFVGESDFSVLEKVRMAEVLPPSTYNHKVPPELEAIVLKALARELDDRYQYASELADDLQRFLITSDMLFSRKDLAQYMKATFAEDVEREKQRLSEYADVKPDEGEKPVEAPAQLAPPSVAPLEPPAVAPLPPSMTPVPPAARLQPAAPEIAPLQVPMGVRKSNPGSVAVADAPPTTISPPPEHRESTVLVHGAEYVPVPGAGSVEQAEPPTVTVGPGKSPPPPVAPRAAPATSSSLPAATRTDAEPIIRPTRASGVRRRPDESVDSATSPDTPSARQQVEDSPSFITRAPSKFWLFGLSGVAALLAANFVLMVVLLRPPSEGFIQVSLPKELAGKNARVNIDGAYLQDGKDFDVLNSPPLKRVKSGSTLVVVGADGYQEQRLVVEVKEGVEPTVVEPKMVRAMVRFAKLIVTTRPADAEVRLNGTLLRADFSGAYTGEVAVDQESTVEARKPGYERLEKKVTARTAEEPLRVLMPLVPMEFPLRVMSSPAGAIITSDGRTSLGVTPTTIRVQGTLTELVLTKRCFEPVTVPVRLPSDPKDPTLVSGSLRRKPGCR